MTLWGYLAQDGHKAFYYARDKQGRQACGRSYERPSAENAHKRALSSCEKSKAKKTDPVEAECKPFMVNNKIVADLEEYGFSEDPNTMLKAALENDRIKIAKQLVADGADPKTVSAGGVSMVSIALVHGDKELLDSLLEKGLTLEAHHKDGSGVFHLAAAGGNLEILQALLEAGANINGQDNEYGYTPLHYAVARLSRKSIRWLIENGADDSLKDNDGISGRDAVNKLLEMFGFEMDYFDKPDPDA